jgi:hypothetical protein
MRPVSGTSRPCLVRRRPFPSNASSPVTVTSTAGERASTLCLIVSGQCHYPRCLKVSRQTLAVGLEHDRADRNVPGA